MRIRYGNFLFAANAVEWSASESLMREGPKVVGRKVTIVLTGMLDGTSQATCAVASGQMRNALRIPYQDLVLLSDSNVALEAITSVGSITGVLCVDGPNFPQSQGAEYVNYRSFNATFEAEYPIPNGVPLFFDYKQTITTSGGFPIIVWQTSINGPPVKVITSPQATYKASQAGTCTGLLQWPIPPGPIFGAAHLMDNPQIVRISPERAGVGVRNFITQWAYEFESATPLNALPGLPP